MEIVKSNPKTQIYQLIADTISEAGEALTLLEINSRLGMNLKSGSITGAIRAGYIAKVGESKVARETSANVAVYKFVNANVNSNKKGQPTIATSTVKSSTTRLMLTRLLLMRFLLLWAPNSLLMRFRFLFVRATLLRLVRPLLLVWRLPKLVCTTLLRSNVERSMNSMAIEI